MTNLALWGLDLNQCRGLSDAVIREVRALMDGEWACQVYGRSPIAFE
ncbi:hypothetical protein ADIS_1976 [Lunatimonas lonarensis]|uniref:Uncharacterized protein n=1 Tax=Lunatimonas lonarensis TaxID=1232681 RepID=R7ZU47_9BACT|nr:hypothetical protein [Lunatimonas lonarensis]EON77573.1 hypothetical protein ADIS_1976 [Lunatimonas lonarensis]